ncbi:MAG: ribonuclease P protein component [Candidatus Coprovivens sp.]
MKRIETIKDRRIFNNIIKNGKFIKNQYFVIYYMKSENENNKYGIAVSNKLGKAVVRNKLKRQTRAIIDDNKNLFKNAFNYIIMIRKTCTEAEYSTMNEAFKSLLEKDR